MNKEYDLQSLQDYFNNQATPAEVVSACYKMIANYAKSVDAEHFEEMQDDISFLSLFVEALEWVCIKKNQFPKV